MAFEFPRFDDPTPIDAQRSWTARFDSYDQHHENVYYQVSIHDDGEITRLMAVISMYSAGDDWTGPHFTDLLRTGIHEVATTGQTNTAYSGQPWMS